MGQCPSSFVPYQGTCVRQCPAKRFSFLTDNNQPRCVSNTDNTKQVNLTPVGAMVVEAGKPLPSLESLRQTDPARYAIFKTESDRVDAEIAIIQSEVDKNKQVDDAFKQLQKAENIRDKSPEAYEQARINYYSLIEGPKWIEGEKERVAKVDVDPLLTQYRRSFDTLTSRQQNQQRTQDVMKSVEEGVLTLKDDFKYTTGIFKEQIENLKSQINIERRGREVPETDATDFYKWVDALLNLFIIGGLLYAVFVFWKKLRSEPAPAYAPTVVST
jgi:hypothetical protein